MSEKLRRALGSRRDPFLFYMGRGPSKNFTSIWFPTQVSNVNSFLLITYIVLCGKLVAVRRGCGMVQQAHSGATSMIAYSTIKANIVRKQ